MNIIISSIKRDFLANLKVSAGVFLAIPVALISELYGDGISQSELLEFTILLAVVTIIPLMFSLNKESASSANQFCSLLAVERKQIIFSKALFYLIYSSAEFVLLLICDFIFDFGLDIAHYFLAIALSVFAFCGYLFFYYMRSRDLAKMFLWCAFFPLMYFAGWGKDVAVPLWNQVTFGSIFALLIISVATAILTACFLLKR